MGNRYVSCRAVEDLDPLAVGSAREMEMGIRNALGDPENADAFTTWRDLRVRRGTHDEVDRPRFEDAICRFAAMVEVERGEPVAGHHAIVESVDVPLGETMEAYEIDIMAGSQMLRTLRSPSPMVRYAADLEMADFGVAQPELQLRIAQMSAAAGRGFAANLTINVA